MAAARRALTVVRERWWPRTWAFLRRFAAAAVEDRVPGLAAEIAFFAVLGIFPGLLIAAGLLGVLDLIVGADLAAGAREQVVGALDAVLTGEAAGVVASVQDLFTQSRGGLLTFGTLGALVTLSGAFAVVVDALNLAYDVPERRSWIRRRLLGLVIGVVTVLALVVALAVVVVGPFLGSGQDLADLVGLGSAFATTWTVLRIPVLVVGLALWATVLFHVAPNRHAPWSESLPGAVLTTALWLLLSLGLNLYLTFAAGTNPVLGAFGGGIIVMMWVYLLSLALLLGGELNAVLHRRDRPRRRRQPDRPAAEAGAEPG